MNKLVTVRLKWPTIQWSVVSWGVKGFLLTDFGLQRRCTIFCRNLGVQSVILSGNLTNYVRHAVACIVTLFAAINSLCASDRPPF